MQTKSFSEIISHTNTSPQKRIAELIELINSSEWNRYNCFTNSTISRGDKALPNKPLSGLSFSVKGNIDCAGFETTLGISLPNKKIPAVSADVISHYQSQGAILIGINSLDPLCLTSSGVNPYFGDVINPVNQTLSPLGSSSGSAVSVAAGLVDFAIGSDFGGSIRGPAAATNTVGIKLSPNVFSRTGVFTYHHDMDCLGLITCNVADLALLLPSSDSGLLPNNIKLIAPQLSSNAPIDADLLIKFEKILNILEINYSLDRMEFDFNHINTVHRGALINSIYNKLVALEINKKPTGIDYIDALLTKKPAPTKIIPEQISDISSQFSALLDDNTYLLLPSLPSTNLTKNYVRHNAAKLQYFYPLANLIKCPAITLPIEADFSIQLVGKENSDQILVSAATQVSGLLFNSLPI